MKVFNYYVLIFVIGSFFGFVIETIWCMIINKKIESRKGLIYSPLIPIYGIAATLISLIINILSLKNHYQIFILGIIISLIVEYLSSFIQEKIFNTKSWDYSEMPFNINGRINLKYTLMFGIIALLYSDLVLPKYNLLFYSLESKILNIICISLTVCLVNDIFISCLACYRMKERKKHIKRNGFFWKYIDYKYPDEYLFKVYANMKFL